MNIKKEDIKMLEKKRKTLERFMRMGIRATLNESTGEIEVRLSEFNKPEVMQKIKEAVASKGAIRGSL